MKPVFLHMQAFGPYAQEQDIDFTKLGDKNFFLITGPTGAGKTTILDAMTFALYGTGSGNLRDGKGMRSDYAPAEFPTRVDFTFALGTRQFKVSRSPEQEVKKKRGEGTHVVPAQAALTEILADGSAKVLAAKVDQVTAAVTELLGFKADQFTQIVVLPQGEFRKFLVAESQDRKTILETIFRTGFYSRLEKILDTQAKKLQTAYDEAKAKQDLWLAQLELAKLEALAPKIAALKKAKAEAEAAVEKAAALRKTAQENLSAAQITESKFTEQELAAAALEKITARAETHDRQRQEVAAAEAALTLQEPYSAALTAHRFLVQYQRDEESARTELAAADRAWQNCRGKLQGSLAALQGTTKLSGAGSQGTAAGKVTAGTAATDAAVAPEAVAAALDQVLAKLQEEAGKLAGVSVTLQQLAAHLVEGEPCPVCGSKTHPQPATQIAAEQATLKKEIAAKKAQAQTLRTLQQQLAAAEKTCAVAGQTYTAAQKAVASQEQENAAATAKFKTALAASKFKDQQEFLHAAQKIAGLEKLRADVAAFEKDLAAATARNKRAAAAVAKLQRPDLAKIQTEFAQVSAAYDAAVQTATVRGQQLSLFTKGAGELAALAAKMEQLSAHYQIAAALAEAAKGNNPSRISLSAFVLQTILDDVLLAANQRLDTMTQGRYALKRSLVLGDARKKSGLNIEVTDAYTGVARPVKTLSGGELFLASLALALGLTDVVQAYAGGLRLDTILVDEGFGSLDPEALDAAISALTALQESGRLVGVISHVAELEERIPTRLEIIPGERGSVARWHV
jgi:exonuclease SbcC